MGGDIIVDSTLGQGSRFAIRIPIDQQPGMEPAPSRGHFPGVTATPRMADDVDNVRPRCLLIGHNAEVRDAIRDHLADDGFHITTASDGAAGITIARSWRPDVIVLDIMLPEMNQWQILRVIKQDPTTFDIPVLMATISDQKGIALGVRDYLVKPVAAARLLGSIDALDLPNVGTILIVEDDLASRDVTRRQLRGRTWTVADALDGGSALEWLEENTPVLILLDLMMPDVDGFEVLNALHRRPEWTSIPVIVLSAMEIPPRLKQRPEDRMLSAVEEQGLDPTTLVRRVRDLLGAHRR
jgi:CheY-like chemotaxis protein